jgi:hypothetical protein
MSKEMLVLELSCPYCMARLTTGSKVKLDAHVKDSNQDGEVLLSAVFGDYTLESDLEIREGDLLEFRCPECDASVMLPVNCKLCGASMVSLNIRDQGYVEFCSRRGCKGHALGGIGDIDQMMQLMNKMFATPFD